MWGKWEESQDEKRRSRALLEGAGRSPSAAAAQHLSQELKLSKLRRNHRAA